MHPGVPSARRLENVRYAILNIVSEAARLEAAGRKILYCNIGDPLKFDFRTPPHLIEAASRALRDGDNGYGPPAGLREAREAVARDIERRGGKRTRPDDVIITLGATEAVDLALTALLEPGDEVLLRGLATRSTTPRSRSLTVSPFRTTSMRRTAGPWTSVRWNVSVPRGPARSWSAIPITPPAGCTAGRR